MVIKKILVRSGYPHNYDTNEASDEAGLDTGTEGGAKQSFKDECDINVILEKFGIGYEIPEGLKVPQYGDFDGINDFHSAANAVAIARENFELLPANIRAKHDNDPGKFVDYALNEQNREEMADLGLLSKEAAERVKRDREQRGIDADAQAATRHSERQKEQGLGLGGQAPQTPSTKPK